MKKQIWFALVVVIAVGAVIGALWALRQLTTPQIVTLPNGDRYRLAGVTWGTNHLQPAFAARVVSRIPSPLTNVVQRTLGKRLSPVTSFKTDEPSLFVWFRPLATSGQSSSLDPLLAVLADQKNVTGTSPGAMPRGLQWALTARLTAPARGGNVQYGAATFTTVPRRSPVLQCVLFEPTASGTSREVGRVRFSNPASGRFPQWQPETLPATKRVGDFDVRLEKLQIGGIRAGAGRAIALSTGKLAKAYPLDLKGLEDVSTAFNLSVRSPSGTGERYEITSWELSDATGNHIHDLLSRDSYLSHLLASIAVTGHRIDSSLNDIRGGLWPDEAAWRLKVELKRDSGFSAPELVTFRGVPLGKEGTVDIFWRTNVLGGALFVLSEHARIQNGGSPGKPVFRLETVALPNRISLAGVKVITDAGEEAYMHANGSWIANDLRPPNRDVHYHWDFEMRSIPPDAKTVDITWAMQTTRTVEFLVAPPKRE